MVICRSNLKQIGLAGHLYAEDNETYIPRGGVWGMWFLDFLPYVGHDVDLSDYRNVDIFRCPSYPDKNQTIGFVSNAWTFNDRTDMTGSQVNGPSKLSIYKSPMTKVYLADNESGPWRPIIDDALDPDIERLDVWKPTHLPDSTIEGREDDTTALEDGRRVAKERHREGSNYLFFDWHADYVATEDMNINYWRDK
jgi:prepilin-type processing-associated H-X9-DG protein